MEGAGGDEAGVVVEVGVAVEEGQYWLANFAQILWWPTEWLMCHWLLWAQRAHLQIVDCWLQTQCWQSVWLLCPGLLWELMVFLKVLDSELQKQW